MNRKHLFLALVLGIALVLVCVSAALAADSPIKTSVDFSKTKFSGPETIDVSITVTNVGEGDLPAPVTLYYPSGKKIDEFGSPTLSVGASKTWKGQWTVTQEELDAGKVVFAVRYSVYDGPLDENGEPKLQGHKSNLRKKIVYTEAAPEISVKRTITPTTAQKDQEVSVVYEITNSGTAAVTAVKIKENTSISSKTGTIDSIAPGTTETYTFTAKMAKKDLTSAATISYTAGGKTFNTKVENATVKYGVVNLSATLKADKKGGVPGDTIKLTLTLKNSGTVDFTNITVTDPELGTVFEGLTVAAGKTETKETELVITKTQDIQFTVKAEDTTGKGIETATGRVTVTSLDPNQQIALSVEAEADRSIVYTNPGTARVKVTVSNNSTMEVKDITVKAVDTTLYHFDSIPAGESASFIRDVDANLPERDGRTYWGTFRFTASCKDQLDQVLKFESNDIRIDYQEPTPEPTKAPLVTPMKPQYEDVPTREPEPAWLEQAETVADTAKWIFAAVAGVLLALLLIGAVRRGKSRSESKKAMDHLEGANYRDYSTAPKRNRRSEISNGGTEEEKPEETEEKPAEEEPENTAQSSELMAETLRRLYSDKPAETAAEVVTETVETAEAAVEETAETAAEEAKEAVEAVEEAAKDVKSAAEDASSRRRRGRKQ